MTADVVTIVVSGEPVGKGRPRFVRATGRVYTPSATAKYESALRYAAQMAMGDRAPFDCAVRVEITAAFPIPVSWPKWRKASAQTGAIWHVSRPDADNLLKAAGDALNEICWRDDSLIAVFQCTKLYSDHPSLTIIVEPLPIVERTAAPARKVVEAEAPLFAGSAA